MKRYQYITKVCDDLWKRWEHEYLPTLREAHRTGKKHDSWPKTGDIVLVKDEGPRNRWKLAKVVELHSGQDGVPMVATLQINQTKLVRPVVKLCPLELHQDLEERVPVPTMNDQSNRPGRKAAKEAAIAQRALVQHVP